MEKKGEYLVREEYRVVFFDGVEYFDIDGPFSSAEEAEEVVHGQQSRGKEDGTSGALQRFLKACGRIDAEQSGTDVASREGA